MSQDNSPSRDFSYTTPRPDVFDMVPIDAGTILDVGCSNGALGESLRRARPGRRVVGIERDAEYARDAATRLDQVLCGDLNDLDWPGQLSGQRFDCMIFADVLEHLPDPGRQLENARRMLAPGGAIVVSLPNIRHHSALASVFLHGTFPRRDRGIFDSTHLRWFTIADAHAFLEQAGFRVEACGYSLRVGDRGGGLLNKIVDRLFTPIAGFFPIREFLTYQFCLRARLA